MKATPPKRPLQFLRWFCREDCLEEIEGDLIEVFGKEHESAPRRAKWKFTWSVIRYFRPEFIKSFKNSYQTNATVMIQHNLRIALRRLGKQKLNTALHIIGLTLGMSVCLLIGLFLRYELSFDTYQDKADRTFRINSVRSRADQKNYSYSTPIPLAEALRTGVTGLEKVALAHPIPTHNSIVEINPEKRFIQDHVLVTDPEFVDIFNIELLRGDAHQALRQPYQALLTETTAKKFFGEDDPIGKTFIYRNEFNITVAGLIRDLPANTHLPASMLLSYVPNDRYLGIRPETWTQINGASVFVVLPENYDLKNLETQLRHIADQNINSKQNSSGPNRIDFDLQALSDIHFESKYSGGGVWVQAVDTSWLWLFGCIAFAVLLLACINFVNLSTAQALTRAKEVGVLKVIGAGRFRLITQYLGESWIIACIAGILAVIIAYASLPAINSLLQKGISFGLLQSLDLLAALLIGIFLTGFLAGIYPAWVITKFNPTVCLKGSGIVTNGHKSSWFSKTLVVKQFSISVSLLIAVWVMAQQVNYLRSKNLGFEKDNIINIEIRGSNKASEFASLLTQIPEVMEFSFATAPPSSSGHWGTLMNYSDESGDNEFGITTIMADEHYSAMYGLRLLSGRLPQVSDTNSVARSLPKEQQLLKVVVNEQLVKSMGIESNEAALGRTFWCGINDSKTEIVGVVADFNFNSLHDAIKPAVITIYPRFYTQAGIKIQANSDIPQTLTDIETAWKKVFPDGVFEFAFLDEQIDAFYTAESRLYSLFKIFAGLAILISCLGLWGLSSYATFQRTKEIGIRKVLGASVSGIVAMLSRDLVKLVLIAILIATPIAWWAMDSWLQSFAFRIDLEWWMFASTGLVAMLIALLTVGFQAIKAALMNPVNSLKSE